MSNREDNEKYPGYPHYPAKEDITKAGNNSGEEQLSEDKTRKGSKTDNLDDHGADVHFVDGTDADVTAEDVRMLDAAEQNMDTTDSINLQDSSLDSADDDGDLLNEDSSLNMDMTGEDLDVPGSGADDDDEIIGEEDEENNYYSLGGDNHEAQEESKGD